ncbi:MAG: OmpA family protein, partial [Candidatus Kapaibacterium sp.]
IAQNRGETSFILSAGPTFSVAETPASERAVTMGTRLGILHAFGPRLSVEFGAGLVTYASVNRERPSDFHTSSIPVDLRLRWTFNRPGASVRPFVFAGLGYQSYAYDAQVLRRSAWQEILAANPAAIRDGIIADSIGSSSWYHPVGAGVRFAVNPRTSLDVSLSACPAWNDDLHPLRDGNHDGWMSAMVGISYVLDDEPAAIRPDDDERERSHQERGVASRDTDGDGLPDDLEIGSTHTDPMVADTDGDGLADGDEVLRYRTNPLRTDTDGDTVTDGDEVRKYRTNPNERDTDAGGIPDGVEIFLAKTDPLDAADDASVTGTTTPEVRREGTRPAPRDTSAVPFPQQERPRPGRPDPMLDSAAQQPAAPQAPAATPKEEEPAVDTLSVPPADTVTEDTQEPATRVTTPTKERYVFAGITFANNQADLLPASRAALDSAYRLLADNPAMNVEIQGYASRSRSAVQREDLAVDLSKRRAKSVMEYLVYRGIARKRLSVAGYGTQRPVDTDDPFSEKNRRIELLVKK